MRQVRELAARCANLPFPVLFPSLASTPAAAELRHQRVIPGVPYKVWSAKESALQVIKSARDDDLHAVALRNARSRISTIVRALYSNCGWREKVFENVVFEPVWRGKLFQMKVLGAAIDSVKFSSKLEPSSRFFGRLKCSALFE